MSLVFFEISKVTYSLIADVFGCSVPCLQAALETRFSRYNPEKVLVETDFSRHWSIS